MIVGAGGWGREAVWTLERINAREETWNILGFADDDPEKASGSVEGYPLLDRGWTILEVKVQDAMPLWLVKILSAAKIRKSSFSKYGEAYRLETLNAHYLYQLKEVS